MIGNVTGSLLSVLLTTYEASLKHVPFAQLGESVSFASSPFSNLAQSSESSTDSFLAPLIDFLSDNAYVSTMSQVSPQNLFIMSLLLTTTVIVLLITLVAVASSSRRTQRLFKFDRLTGLPSPEEFNIAVKRVLRQNPNKRFAFIYCDINRFKFINETYGYMEGDALLCSMSDMIRDFIEPSRMELATRSAADNFILLVNYVNNEEFHRRLNSSPLVKESNFHTREKGYRFSVSSGVYLVERTDDPEQIDSLIVHAHYAKDQAKHILRNNLVMYDARLRESLAQEKEIENKMYHALENGHFVPYYQAKTDIFTGGTVGAEALARWIDPERGVVPPSEFIPYFEKSGFIISLDLFIFEKVCEQISQWTKSGFDVVRVSCNFSRTHIENPDLPTQLLNITKKYNVSPEMLEIEITESVAMDLDKGVVRFVNTLRENGFKLAIDDFGTGFSSLAVLNQIEMDILKLDRSFFNESSSQQTGRTIIRSLVDLAKNLDIEVVCEGIETEDQIATMKSVDCRVAQGYYYSMPAPAKEFEKFLNQKGKSAQGPPLSILMN